ncbi:MAG TPA: protein kinase [Gemmatimonadales bacterium]|nr:protein kinase [Gemmatimonadales bacterium]
MLEQLNDALTGLYVVERELGRGGMATVWLARDLRHERAVALKVLEPGLAGSVGADRFVREVRLTARLRHPNILPILDSGVIPAHGVPLPWYTMAYIPGESLRARLGRDRQLPVGEALRITEMVASALDAAHRAGIVHRDVKPENILLADGHVYVVDFGIAKAVADTSADHLTSTGLAIGTPAYMSPEQAAAGIVDARTDQYSLGCVLYELLTGEPPFTGATVQAVVARRFAEAARPIRPVRPAVPLAVEGAVLRALERVPADRFESVAAFADALGATATAATPALTPGPRRRLPLLLAAMLAATVLGAFLVWRRDASPRPAAVDPQVLALYQRGVQGYNRRTPEGARDAVAAYSAALRRDSSYAPAWSGLAQMYVQANRRQFAIPGVTWDSMLRLAVSANDRAIALDPGSADSWVTRSTVARAIDPTDERGPLQAARRAVELDSSSAPAWHALAISLLDSGDPDAAMATWHQCTSRNPAFTQCLAFLALSFYWRRQYDSAAFWVDSALAIDPNYLLGRTTAGDIEIERGNFPKAIAAFEAARRLTSDVEAVNALAGRAKVEARAGETTRARATLREVDSLAAGYVPLQAHLAVYVAQAHAAVGERDQATAWLEQYSPREDLHFQLHLRCDPGLDLLRNEARFRALLSASPAHRC